MPLRRLFSSPLAAGLGALVLGFSLGLVLAKGGAGAQAFVGWMEVLGQLWVNALRMCLVPLVVALLVTSVAGMEDLRSLGRIGARTLLLFLAMLAGAAVLSALTGSQAFTHLGASAELLKAYAGPGGSPAELPTLKGFLLALVPSNPMKALVDGAMLPLIVFTTCFALAVTRLPKPHQEPLLAFFRALREAMMTLMKAVLKFTPLGVLGLSVSLGATSGLKLAGAVGSYLLWVCGLQLFVGLLVYPLVRLLGGGSMRAFARAAAPAQAVAAGTRSSLASLPALIDGHRAVYGEKPEATDFVLPLAVSTFKLNTPVSDLVGPFFLAALMGASLGPVQIAAMTVVAVAMSFSNPGIPSGGLFVVTAPVLMAAGLPLEGIGLLVAVDAIPDLFATVLNVTGDQAVAVLATQEQSRAS